MVVACPACGAVRWRFAGTPPTTPILIVDVATDDVTAGFAKLNMTCVVCHPDPHTPPPPMPRIAPRDWRRSRTRSMPGGAK
jgi:hypothetical protein